MIELVLKFMSIQYNNHGNSFLGDKGFRLHRYVNHKPVFMCISQKHNVVGSNTAVSINVFKISHSIHFVLKYTTQLKTVLCYF